MRMLVWDGEARLGTGADVLVVADDDEDAFLVFDDDENVEDIFDTSPAT